MTLPQSFGSGGGFPKAGGMCLHWWNVARAGVSKTNRFQPATGELAEFKRDSKEEKNWVID